MKAVAIGMGICGSLHLLFFTVRLMLFPVETGAGYPIPYVPDFVLNPYWPTRLFGLLFTVISMVGVALVNRYPRTGAAFMSAVAIGVYLVYSRQGGYERWTETEIIVVMLIASALAYLGGRKMACSRE